MTDMQRMPLHRVLRESEDGDFQGWIADFEGQLDALNLEAEAQKERSKNYEPKHALIDHGGHLAGSIRVQSFPGSALSSMETLVNEIRKARGSYHRLGDRMDALMGGAYAKLWIGDDFLEPVSSTNLVHDGTSLVLGTETEQDAHQWGESGRSWELGTGAEYELSTIADTETYGHFTFQNHSPTTQSGGTIAIVNNPSSPGRKAYRLSAWGHYLEGAATFTSWIGSVTPYSLFTVDIDLAWIGGSAGSMNSLILYDGQKVIELTFTPTGFTVSGQTYTHAGPSLWSETNRLSLVKYGTDLWEVRVNGEVVIQLTYGAPASGAVGTAYVQFLTRGGNTSPLFNEIHVTRGTYDANMSQFVSVVSGNRIQLDGGAEAGHLVTRPVELDEAAVSKLITSAVWEGAGDAQVDIRTSEFAEGPWGDWIPLGNGQPVPEGVAHPWKLWYQLRVRLLRETASVSDSGTGLGSVSFGAPALRGTQNVLGEISFDYGPSLMPPGNGVVSYDDWLASGWTMTGDVPYAPVSSQDGMRTVPRLYGNEWDIYGKTSVLTSPEFTLTGDVHYVCYRTYYGLGTQATTTAAIVDAVTGAVLSSQAVGSYGAYVTRTIPIRDDYVGRAVKLRFTSTFPAWIGARFDFRLDRYWQNSTMYYRTAAHQPGGGRVTGVRWKQRVGEASDLTGPGDYPIIKLRTAESGVRALYAEPFVMPPQITPAGVWTDVYYPLEFPAYGEHVSLEVEGRDRAGATVPLQVSDLEVDWEAVTYEGDAELHTVTLNYDREMHLTDGDVVLRFDSTSDATSWKRLNADYGFPVEVGDLKWERRVMAGQRDAYVNVDAFEVYAPMLVSSPAIGSNFPVSGFGADSSVLFTTYLYNERAEDQALAIPVTSALGNTWELYRDRISLGRTRPEYTLILPARQWTRVDLFWHRDGVTSETLTTGFAWHAANGIKMSSKRNLAGGIDFFIRSADREDDLGSLPWEPIKDGNSAELSGRYVEIKAVFTANATRDKSPALTSLVQNYLIDPVRDFQMSLRSISVNMAKTVFEVKTIAMADEHNLLNIYQDLFEDSSDISPASVNITRDALLPGIRQLDPDVIGHYQAIPFENRSYVPSFVLLVAEDTGAVVYEVSRDGGSTWTNVVPGEYTELGGGLGISVVLRATLSGGAAIHRWALVL